MIITISKENYLKTIAEAEAEGETVIAATLARWLQISPPAVTAGIRRLKRDGMVRVAKDGRIQLTAPGRNIADRLLIRFIIPSSNNCQKMILAPSCIMRGPVTLSILPNAVELNVVFGLPRLA